MFFPIEVPSFDLFLDQRRGRSGSIEAEAWDSTDVHSTNGPRGHKMDDENPEGQNMFCFVLFFVMFCCFLLFFLDLDPPLFQKWFEPQGQTDSKCVQTFAKGTSSRSG